MTDFDFVIQNKEKETQDFYNYAKRKGQIELIYELKDELLVHERNIRCFDDLKQLAAFQKGVRVAQMEIINILEEKAKEIANNG